MINIAGMQKLTVQDYPNHLAALIFTQGCNLNCPYCQNSELIKFNKQSTLSEEEVFSYLEKRKKVLDGVAITGGEPLVQKDIITFIERIKEIGLKVKLDTNGTMPEVLEKLISANLIDYVALDIKNDFANYDSASGVKKINTDNIKKTISILKGSNVDHEYRTTIMKEFHNIDNIKKIAEYIGPNQKYFLQNFEKSEFVINKNLTPFSKEELVLLEKELKKAFPNVKVRGI